jgi:predicted kinase
MPGIAWGMRLRRDNLRLGRTVIADSVNPLSITRDAWLASAHRAAVRAIEIEITCSDPAEHRRRVETRTTDVPELPALTWRDVVARDYQPWDRERVVIDTAGQSVDDSVTTLRAAIASARGAV